MLGYVLVVSNFPNVASMYFATVCGILILRVKLFPPKHVFEINS